MAYKNSVKRKLLSKNRKYSNLIKIQKIFCLKSDSIGRVCLLTESIIIKASSSEFLFGFLYFIKPSHWKEFNIFVNKLCLSNHFTLFSSSRFSPINPDLNIFQINSFDILYMISFDSFLIIFGHHKLRNFSIISRNEKIFS